MKTQTIKVDAKPRFTAFFLLLMVILGFSIYSNTFHASFHLDDVNNIVENPPIWKLSDTGHLWAHFPQRFVAYWSFALSYHFSKLNVLGYHLFNFLAHLFSSLFVFGLVSVMLKTPRLKGAIPAEHCELIAFFSGLIFLCHPVQTQAITYIVQRIASLAALFYLASVFFYLKARVDKKKVYYLLALIAAVLAMFTKEIAYTLPFALLLFELSLMGAARKNIGKKILAILPFFLLLLVVYLFCYHRDVQAGYIKDISIGSEMSRVDYLLTQFNVIRTYIRLLFVPLNQNLDYDYPTANSLMQPSTFASFLFLAAILFFAVKIFKKQPLIALGIFWFFLTLSVESSIVPIADVIFEHRLYLPLFGFALLVPYGVYQWFPDRKKFLIILSSIVLVLAVLTYLRNGVWKDEVTLWQDVIKKSPNKPRGYDNLGIALGQLGRYEEATENFEKVLKINPNSVNTRVSLGIRLAEEGKNEEAMKEFNEALKIQPEYYKTYNSFGIVMARKGNYEEAIRYYKQAIQMNPEYEKAYNNMGIAFRKSGKMEEAIESFKKAVSIQEDYAEAHVNLAACLMAQGKYDEALEHYRKALSIQADDAEAYNGMGVIYYNQGKIEDAIIQYAKALQKNPEHAEAHNNIGAAFAQIGDLNRAAAHFAEAVRLKPDYMAARQNLEAILGSHSSVEDSAGRGKT